MRVGGSNPLCSTIQSVSFRTYRRIARNPRVCARFAIMHGPGERPRQLESVESSKTYPGAIWLGPWIIALNSPAHGTRRTGLMKVVVSVELPGFARGSCLRRDTGVIAGPGPSRGGTEVQSRDGRLPACDERRARLTKVASRAFNKTDSLLYCRGDRNSNVGGLGIWRIRLPTQATLAAMISPRHLLRRNR
jgi:hypothetical protein